MVAVTKESFPLHWVDGWPRTRPQDRRSVAAWKRTANQYRDALEKELTRMESPSFIISSNVPVNQRGNMTPGVEPLDIGVAVYFSRKVKEDFRWQDALGIHDPAPTEQQVQDAFRRLAQVHHPDRGGDLAMFQEVSKHRDHALAWINRKSHQRFDHAIACDLFREVRLNIASIAFTLKAIRQIERCGSSALVDRAFKGFAELPAHAGASA